MRFQALIRAAMLCAGLPAGLAAQARFEGVVTMTAGIRNGKPVETRFWIKGPRARIEMPDPILGPVGFILDGNGSVTKVLDSTRQFVPVGTGGGNLPLKFSPTGRSDTVAGYPCAYYKVLGPTGDPWLGLESCIATALGFVAFGPAGPFEGDDQRPLKAQFPAGFMVLKTVRADGSTRAEVIRIERTAVSNARFVVPPGYLEVRNPDLPLPPPPKKP
jgi:hypothetical protein